MAAANPQTTVNSWHHFCTPVTRAQNLLQFTFRHSDLLDWKQRAQPLHMETEVSCPESKGYLYSELGSPSISDLSTNEQFQSCNDSLDTDTSSHIDNI